MICAFSALLLLACGGERTTWALKQVPESGFSLRVPQNWVQAQTTYGTNVVTHLFYRNEERLERLLVTVLVFLHAGISSEQLLDEYKQILEKQVRMREFLQNGDAAADVSSRFTVSARGTRMVGGYRSDWMEFTFGRFFEGEDLGGRLYTVVTDSLGYAIVTATNSGDFSSSPSLETFEKIVESIEFIPISHHR